jgi:uncharacterized protein (TIGR02722 family)
VITSRLLSSMLIVAFIGGFAGCGGSSRSVSRIESDQTVDLSGDWNDTDSRLVAQEMINDVLNRPWLADFRAANNRQPVVVVGTVKNRTVEHIQTVTFIKNLERELINSGRVKFVANKDERQEVRDERADQQENASAETMKKFQKELGADFVLRGDIASIVDQEGGDQVKFYQTNLELVNLETNEIAWSGEKKIKKLVSQSGSKF